MTEDEQQAKQRQIILAYKSVFGVGVNRSAAQKIVWDDLMENLTQPAFIVGQNGHYDPLQAALNDGGRRVIRQIRKFVEFKAEDKPKKKVAKKQ